MPVATVGDIAIHYETAGAGDPVVLLHGQGGRGDAWDAQIAALSPRYRVIAPDLRGHGRSTLTPRPYAMATLAADVAGLCRALALGPCHVVGHSLGGMVALQLALDSPELARSLAILNSTAIGRGARLRSFIVGLYVRLRGMPAFARANTHMHLPERDQEPLRRRLIAVMGSTAAGAYLACQDAVDAFDVAARLPEIACPTLVVHSDQDVIPLADKQQIATRVQRGRLATIERSRHVVLWDRPEALNELLLAFLAGA